MEPGFPEHIEQAKCPFQLLGCLFKESGIFLPESIPGVHQLQNSVLN
jgi:hypothetical protein